VCSTTSAGSLRNLDSQGASWLFHTERLHLGATRGIPCRMKNARSSRLALALAGAALPLLVACGHDAPPPKTPAKTETQPVLTSTTPQRNSDQEVSLSQNIRDLCKIDDSDRSPKFDFDSTQLSSADRDILQQVAKCMTDGALKGKNIELIGRADPRGEQEYNMTLGSSRATSAHKYLTGLGIAEGRMSETSRGALDATGHDEEGWSKDRRVDIRVK
jgi:peptidoglycan-associated lipoprotein